MGSFRFVFPVLFFQFALTACAMFSVDGSLTQVFPAAKMKAQPSTTVYPALCANTIDTFSPRVRVFGSFVFFLSHFGAG